VATAALPRRSGARVHADERQPPARNATAPIVAAVDGSTASAGALETAVWLGAEMDAPVVFVYVRPGPAGFLGEPVYQLRLTAAMARARRALGQALRSAARAGVAAESEILEGSPRKRIREFARERGARLVVVGPRRRRFGRSVSSSVGRTARRPVVVAHELDRMPVAANAAGLNALAIELVQARRAT
jgi:nucleotide-binding universal stress UspA family protein